MQFASRTRQQGLAVVISDFLDPHGFEPGLKLLASMGHDVFVVHDRLAGRQRSRSAMGDVRFVDAETGEVRDVDVTPALARAYGEAWQTHAEDLERFCGRFNLGYVRADAEVTVRGGGPDDVPQGPVPRMSFGAMAAWQALVLIGAAGAAAAVAVPDEGAAAARAGADAAPVAARVRPRARADVVGARPPRRVARGDHPDRAWRLRWR